MRDLRQVSKLRKAKWKVLIVWQCQLKKASVQKTLVRVVRFLGAV
jgi:G:T-mismatch repair DNA endonuclease (very short patch repair protein)